jgi:uncharacterized protein involved in exopolysaccharide biosynthesis
MFSPSSSRPASGMAALAGGSLAGLLGEGGGGSSPEFYVALVQSNTLLYDAAASEYPLVRDGDTVHVTLAEAFGIERDTEEARRRAAAAELGRRTTATADRVTNLVSVRTQAPSASLAVAFNRRIVALVESYNRERRKSQAVEERRFIEARRQEARTALAVAESAVESFLEQNRQVDLPPRLALESERLKRQVTIRQELYLELERSYQQARIMEVRDAALISIVEHPERTVRARGSGVSRNAALGLFLGLLLGITVAFSREALRREPAADPDEYAEFRRLTDAARADLSWRRWLAGLRRENGRRRTTHAGSTSRTDTGSAP